LSAVTMVATPCWMNSPAPIRAASRAAGRYTARAKRDRSRSKAVVDERAKLRQGPGQICESGISVECKQVRVVDAAHPPIDILRDHVRGFRTNHAAPQRICPYPREDQEHPPPVTCHGAIL
jgi:hypothetical protein